MVVIATPRSYTLQDLFANLAGSINANVDTSTQFEVVDNFVNDPEILVLNTSVTPPTFTTETNYPDNVAADYPTSYWRLADNNGAGVAVDSNQNLLSAYPRITSSSMTSITQHATSFLSHSGAAQFTASTSAIVFPNNTSLQIAGDLTVEFWLNLASLGTNGSSYGLVTKDGASFNSGEYSIYFFNNAGVGQIAYGHNGFTTFTGGSLTTATWYHVAITRVASTKTVTIYVNGSSVATGTYVTAPGATNNNVVLGNHTGVAAATTMSMTEVALYPQALSSGRISTHYAWGVAPDALATAYGGTATLYGEIPYPGFSAPTSNAYGSSSSSWGLFIWNGGTGAAGTMSGVDWLNVKDYGAVGNGVADDTAAIQTALNAVPTNGGVVYFPAGNYLITSSLSVTVTGTALQGDGFGSAIRYDGTVVSPAIKAASNIRVFMRDLRISQQNASHAGTAIDASNFNTSVLERLLIDNGTGAAPVTGILINSATALYNCVRDCRIVYGGTAAAGISLQGGANSTVLDNIRLVPSGDDAASSGIYISGTHSATIIRPDVESGSGNGVWLDTGAHATTLVHPYIEGMNVGFKITSGVIAPTINGSTIQGNTTNILDNGSISPWIVNAWPNSGTNSYSSSALTNVANFTINGVPVPSTTYQASDVGFLAWTYDPSTATNSTLITNGTVYLAQVQLRYAQTVSKLAVGVTVAASGVTANQNFIGLYDSGGTLRASTAAGTIDTPLASAGLLNASVATPYAAPAGTYWVALLCNATTAPTIARSSGATLSIPNSGASAANLRYAVNGTARTTLAATITTSSNSATNAITMWAAAD